VPDTSRPPESQGPDTPPAAERSGNWRSNLVFIADVSQKLAIPLLTVAATGLGIYLSYNANERARLSREREQEIAAENNRLSLQNQREQSETGIRSAMFRELVGPLLSGEVEKDETSQQAAERLALHAELLTLNFHEHFELGPALRYVDSLDSLTDDARNRLRSAARRVISRQLAPLMATPEEGGEARKSDYVEIKLSEYLERRPAHDKASDSAKRPILPSCYQPPAAEPGQVVDPCKGSADDPEVVEMICSTERPMRELKIGTGATATKILIQEPVQPLIIRSPDCQDTLKVTFSSFDWDGGAVTVFVETQPPGDLGEQEAAGCAKKSNHPPAARAGKLPRQSIEFTLTPYSLPFSDNTLLASGNRFGVYVKTADEIACKPDGQGTEIERQAVVWFVWFPQDFVPPRERPLELDLKTSDSEARRAEDQSPTASGGPAAPGAAGT
jgi:hypothetical protein